MMVQDGSIIADENRRVPYAAHASLRSFVEPDEGEYTVCPTRGANEVNLRTIRVYSLFGKLAKEVVVHKRRCKCRPDGERWNEAFGKYDETK